MSFTSDGHKITVGLGPDFHIDVDVACPGGCALWHPGVRDELRGDPCWLRYYVRQAGSEFLEWWTTHHGGDVKRIVLTDGPVEIEWKYDGGDEDGELWWRPIATPSGKDRP